jgi:surfactin synthase thioesterase subunit
MALRNPYFLDAELMELILPIVRADFAVCDSYLFHPQPFLSCPVFAFGGLSDPDVKPQHIAEWRYLTSGGFASHLLEGDHFFILQEPQVRQICAAITNQFFPGAITDA